MSKEKILLFAIIAIVAVLLPYKLLFTLAAIALIVYLVSKVKTKQ